jgi:hypothetical protein
VIVYVSHMKTLAGSDWQTFANISTTFGVFVAVSGVIVTLILTLRSEKLTRAGQMLEREQAEATAARSEAAAALTEEYTRRVVEALETMAQKDLGVTDALPSRTRSVRWSMTHHAGGTYLLTNVGGTAAKDVQVTAHETMFLRPPDLQTVGPDEALTFMAVRTLGTSDSTITVRWLEDGTGEPSIWKYPLPPRDPR